VILLVFAVLPAICEELAFRGFILSGLRHLGNRRQAIVISAIVFGITHTVHQQSILACFAGLVLAFLAIHSGNIWTPMLFHVTHNTLTMLHSRINSSVVEQRPILHFLLEENADGQWEYRVAIVLGGMLAAGLIFAKLSSVSFRQTPEEKLYEAIRHDTSSAPVG
jgi:sodium transport system permease protein